MITGSAPGKQSSLEGGRNLSVGHGGHFMPLGPGCLLAASYPDGGCARVNGGSQHPTHEQVKTFPQFIRTFGADELFCHW